MSLPPAARPERCWCVDRVFPKELLARAPAGRCICAQCLADATDTTTPRTDNTG